MGEPENDGQDGQEQAGSGAPAADTSGAAAEGEGGEKPADDAKAE